MSNGTAPGVMETEDDDVFFLDKMDSVELRLRLIQSIDRIEEELRVIQGIASRLSARGDK